MWLLLMLVFSMSPMEHEFQQVSLTIPKHELVVARIDALRDRPWHKQAQFWKPNEEYKAAKDSIHDYLRHLDHLSGKTDHEQTGLEQLLAATQQVRLEEEKKSKTLSTTSKTSIGVGSGMILLSMVQAGLTIYNTSTACPSVYDTLTNLVVAGGGCLSGVLLIHDGLKNGDRKADAGRIAHLQLLLLEKFQEITQSSRL